MSGTLNFQDFLKIIEKLIDFAAEGIDRMEQAQRLTKRFKPHPLLTDALDVLEVKTGLNAEVTLDVLMDEDAKWAGRAERLLGFKPAKRGMSVYFLLHLQNLAIAHIYNELVDHVDELELTQLKVALPLASLAARYGVSVETLPLALALDGNGAEAVLMTSLLPKIRKMKADSQEAGVAVAALTVVLPAIFGYPTIIEDLVNPIGKAKRKGMSLADWTKKGGATLADFARAKGMAEEFYTQSILDPTVAKVASSKLK